MLVKKITEEFNNKKILFQLYFNLKIKSTIHVLDTVKFFLELFKNSESTIYYPKNI
jgi:hypothetical protein